nr:tRNA (adenosine(37)-N6)-threonylcarbamoyltransferase complex dimerization subunit type 1 TsaB [Saprospiraceae bacterium]
MNTKTSVSSVSPTILCLETAGLSCSVCLANDKGVLYERVESAPYKHSEILAPFVDEILKEAGLKVSDLSAIVINKGPGSYTGLRVGFSLIKALAFSCGVPMIGISGLEGLAWTASEKTEFDLCIPMLDARRMEVYLAIYDSQLKTVEEPRPQILNETYFSHSRFMEKNVLLTGNGIEKLSSFSLPANISLTEGHLKASNLIAPGLKALIGQKTENTAYFEPMYLKEARITTSNKTHT